MYNNIAKILGKHAQANLFGDGNVLDVDIYRARQDGRIMPRSYGGSGRELTRASKLRLLVLANKEVSK